MLVWFCGGAWDSGDKTNYAFIARRFTAIGYAVAITNYRLVPEVQFPAFVEDSAAALAQLTACAEKSSQLTPRPMLLSGHSARAYIAVQAVANTAYLAVRGLSTCKVTGIIGLAGTYDFHPYDVHASQAAFGSAPASASASQTVEQDLTHMPPLLLITGDSVTTVRPLNTVRLAEAAPRAQLVKVKGATHIDVLMGLATRFTRRDAVLQPIEDFLQSLPSERVDAAPISATAFRNTV